MLKNVLKNVESSKKNFVKIDLEKNKLQVEEILERNTW